MVGTLNALIYSNILIATSLKVLLYKGYS